MLTSMIIVRQGAKNHGVIMPDASKESTINQVCTIRLKFLFLLIFVNFEKKIRSRVVHRPLGPDLRKLFMFMVQSSLSPHA